jgi:hypothetical protein
VSAIQYAPGVARRSGEHYEKLVVASAGGLDAISQRYLSLHLVEGDYQLSDDRSAALPPAVREGSAFSGRTLFFSLAAAPPLLPTRAPHRSRRDRSAALPPAVREGFRLLGEHPFFLSRGCAAVATNPGAPSISPRLCTPPCCKPLPSRPSPFFSLPVVSYSPHSVPLAKSGHHFEHSRTLQHLPAHSSTFQHTPAPSSTLTFADLLTADEKSSILIMTAELPDARQNAAKIHHWTVLETKSRPIRGLAANS